MMREESVTYPPRPSYPLYLTAKRYWLPGFEKNWNDPDALTLIFLHATSFHKETWEPTLETLFELALEEGNPVKIREAWCIDCPNHGAAGQLNEDLLLQPEHFLNFTCEKFAYAAHHFLNSGPEHGARVDFRKRNLVGIGHSLGGNAMAMLQYIEPIMPFSSIILVDPMLSPAGPDHLKRLRAILIKGAYERRDVWPDRATAMVAIKKRDRTAKWDPKILDVFIKYGLRPHTGSYYVEAPYPGVTLACSRDQEAAMYRDPDGATKPVADLNRACKDRPVHVILGGVHDFMPKRTHDALLDKKSGRKFASETILPDIGHLVVQEAPDKLAHVLNDCLIKNTKLPVRSKL